MLGQSNVSILVTKDPPASFTCVLLVIKAETRAKPTFSLFSLNSETLSAVTNTPFPTLQLKRLNLREKELRLKDHNMNIIFMN